MNDRKTVIRFFTIADYEEEEVWLRNMHRNGWKLLRMTPPCIYVFEMCTPEDVAYRMDYKNNSETSNYFQIFRDYGWEYIDRSVGWLYFRKPSSETDSEHDEIFSDNETRLEMINHVIKTRLFPICIMLLCCVLPNFLISIATGNPCAAVFTGFVFGFIFTLLIYCSLRLRKLRKKYRND